MFTHKDIQHRQIFIVNGLQHRKLKLLNYQLGVYDTQEERFLTKIPFHKILCLFVMGHTTMTSPLIEKCNRNNIPIVVVKPNFRIVFFYGQMAEANFLLRQKQHQHPQKSTELAKVLLSSKFRNQLALLDKTRKKSTAVFKAKETCNYALEQLPIKDKLDDILALEGMVAKQFFQVYFVEFNWSGRLQRAKTDRVNATLDIGYFILFNFVECFLRMFGFDLYIGVYHQTWFKRKSLVCDIVEPFRCLIDWQVRKSMNYKTFTEKDFDIRQGRYYLKSSESEKYYTAFFEVLVDRKKDIFTYIRDYYRCFMGRKSVTDYPIFKI